MKALEIQSVIERIGPNVFFSIVTHAIQDDWYMLECAVGGYQPSDPFRQELRKAVRWVVEHGMPDK